MSDCTLIRSQFSDYLDGAISGTAMHSIATHLGRCEECAVEFAECRTMQRVLSSVGPAKPPADLGLRLRVAISQEKARTVRRRIEAWQLYWQNSLAPVLVRGAAGLASAVILLGALALMIGTVAAPPPVAATEATAETASIPQFLYTVGGTGGLSTFTHPVLVEAEISRTGRVYDYRILAGPSSEKIHQALDSILLLSRFKPANFLGQPVRGRALLSFSGG